METLNLKYGRFVLWAGCGGFLVGRFLRFLSIYYPLAWVLGISGCLIMMFWVWQDIAKNGIRTVRMMVPGILAAAGWGPFVFIGLVLWCLAQNHQRGDLWGWGLVWIVVGVAATIGSYLLALS